jgi:hypothetical protein
MEEQVPSRGTPLFQINENDLATLEHVLPELLMRMYPYLDARTKSQWRKVQQVLVDVRWNYGPPLEVHVIPADGDTTP